MERITVETEITASPAQVWLLWTEPAHVTKWCHASHDWHAPHAENDLRVGGSFRTTMAAKDGSAQFDFTGKYTVVAPYHELAYVMADGRTVRIQFIATTTGTKVTETFDPESENSHEAQSAGWQTILDNFKGYAQAHAARQ